MHRQVIATSFPYQYSDL